MDRISSERLSLIREIFNQASECPERERERFLQSTCGSDRELWKTVKALLDEAAGDQAPFDELVNDVIRPSLESLGRAPDQLQEWFDSKLEPSPDEPDPLLGRTISHFEILSLIGRGGMGVVYRAHDRTLDRTVALKFLPPSLGSSRETKDRFVHEARAASGLNHPNIATIHEIGETGDHQMFIAMGYYPGKTLRERFFDGPVPVDEGIRIAIQLATGLAKAHEEGVIHRDVKPGNIIVTMDGTVVLLDFGLAKLSSETGYTRIGQIAGTLAYMAPEQIRGEPIDERTDIWSFGVVLYEMLTGHRPYAGENAQSLIRAILEDDPVAPTKMTPGLPGFLDTVLGLCLAKKPAHRYQNVRDLLDGLKGGREGSAPGRRWRVTTWKGRSWSGMAGLGVGAIAVVVSVILLARIWSGEDSGISAPGLESPPPVEEGDVDFAAAASGDRVAKTGYDDETIRMLKQVWRQNPDNADASIALGTHHDFSLHQYDDAMFWYRRAHALEGEKPFVSNRIGDLYEILGDREAAVWWTERALKLAPESDLSNSLRVKALLLRGKALEALETFQTHPTGRVAAASSVTVSPLLQVLPYYGSGFGGDRPEDTSSLNPLLEGLLDAGQTEQALRFCEDRFPSLLNPPGPDPGRATLRVVGNPFGSHGNRVLEFDPGFLKGEIWNWHDGHVITRWQPRHRSVALRLPPGALKAISDAGSDRWTLYLRIGGFEFEPEAAAMNVVWGLAASAGFSDYAVPSYPDLSVQSRYESDGNLQLRDGMTFVDFCPAPPETGVFYELWYVVDRDRNAFDVHIRGGREYPERALVFREAYFRKETRHDLDLFVVIHNTGMDTADPRRRLPVYIDDIHLYPGGENLGLPGDGWVKLDDFEDGDVSDWMRRLSRCDHLVDIAEADTVLNVVRTLQASGRDTVAGELLDGIEETAEATWLPDSHRIVALRTRIHALRGERDAVLEGLRTLLSSGQTGWYWDGLLRRDELRVFLDDPEIREGVSRLDAARERQLARIREMERQNELGIVPTLSEDVRPITAVSFTPLMSGPALEKDAGFTGQAWGDYDGDGLVDLVLTEQEKGNVRLYRNRGGGSFSRVTGVLPATDLMSPNQPAWADYDNDGDLDLFIATDSRRSNGFYQNDGRGGFLQVTEGDWVQTPSSSDNAAWGDCDGDGFVDLYVASDRDLDLLYRNNGDGTMTPRQIEANRRTGYSNGLAWSDFDGDGDLDLFVGGQDQVQYRNDGTGGFSWVSPEEGGLPALFHGLGVSSADFDNDGDLDVLCTSWNEAGSCHLYRNDGSSGFYDVTRAVPSVAFVAGNGSAWGDFDNDGWIDFYIANGNGRNLLYHNEKGDRFTLVVGTPPVDGNPRSFRCAWVDFDNDGDLDLSVTNEPNVGSGTSFQLFRNEGGAHHWIVIRLVGAVSNRTAFGAKVRVGAVIGGEEVSQLRQIGGNGDTPGELRAHFGLGDASVVETLRIEWPSGIIQEEHDVAADQFITVEEPAAGSVPLSRMAGPHGFL